MTKRKQRIILVCDNCHHRKIKCNKKLPCDRCVSSGIEVLCQYSTLEKELAKQGKSTHIINSHSKQEVDLLKQKVQELQDALAMAEQGRPATAAEYKPLETSKQRLLELSTVDHTTDFFASYGSDVFCVKAQDWFVFTSPVSFRSVIRRDSAYIVFWHYNMNKRKDTPDIDPIIRGVSTLLDDGKTAIEYDEMTQQYFGVNYIPKFDNNSKRDHELYKNTINGYRAHSSLLFYPQYLHHNQNLLSRLYHLLPTKLVIFDYVNCFFQHLHVYFPIFDRGTFINDVDKILKADQDGKLQITIDLIADIALLGSLLYLLRFSYLYIIEHKNTTLASNINYEVFTNNPIYIDVILCGKECLKEFDMGFNLSFEALQMFLMAKVYKLYGQDGYDPFEESDFYTSTLLISAISLGLNRDPNMFVHNNFTWLVKLQRRKIWYLLLLLETTELCIHGRPMVNDNYSDVILGELNIPSDDCLYQVVTKIYKIRPVIAELLKLVVDIRKPLDLQVVSGLILKVDTVIDTTYLPLSQLLASIQGTHHLASNVFHLQFYLDFKLLVVRLYLVLYLIYERKGDATSLFMYYKKMLTICFEELKPFTAMIMNAPRVSAIARLVLLPIYLRVIFVNTLTASMMILHLNYSVKLYNGTDKSKHFHLLVANLQFITLSSLHYVGNLSGQYLLAFRIMRIAIYIFQETYGLRTFDNACRGESAAYIFTADQIHELCTLFETLVNEEKSHAQYPFDMLDQFKWFNFFPFDHTKLVNENITLQRLHLNQRENMWLYYVSESQQRVPDSFKSEESLLYFGFQGSFEGLGDFLPSDFLITDQFRSSSV